MEFEILDSDGNVQNVIVADINYMEAFYSGRYRQLVDQLYDITKQGFINRFTTEEWNTISSSTDPIIIGIVYDIENINKSLNLRRSFVKDALQILVNKNLLTSERMSVILETPVDFLEKP